MSAQILELLILAAVAFFIINKLISSLGTTSDDDPAKNSFFGEPKVKDITNTAPDESNDNSFAKRFLNKQPKEVIDLTNLVDSSGDGQKIADGIAELSVKMPSFRVDNFIKGAKGAFKLIIESKTIPAQLEALVDKRFIEKFAALSNSYGKLSDAAPDLKISDVYSFGNNIFIKTIISGHNIIDNIDNFKEEWTFSKNMNDNSPGWHLNNVERLLV